MDKAQSAMEYLITYGWAILIIAVVISLLYLYIAVPKIIVPSTCSFVTGAVCQDMIFGTNTTTHATVVGFFITNSRKYPVLNPEIYVNVYGKNTTAAACKPSFVLSGGSIICVLPVSGVSSSLGQFFSGSVYMNVSYCGLAPNTSSPSSCSTVPKETYTGLYSAHAEPLVSPSYSLSLSVQNSTNPANNAKDKLTAVVDLLGYAQSGATINFTATFTNNGTKAVPPYSLQSQYVTSGTNGQAIDYIWGTKVANVTVTADYAGLNASKTINFIAVVPIFFNISNIPSSLQSSSSSVATIDGVAYSYPQLTKKPTGFDWGCNTTHTYDFEPIVYNSSGTRFVFNSVTIDGITSTSNSGTVTVSTCKTQSITASYSPQYELYEISSPSAGGSVSPGTLWYAPSSSVTISETPNTTGHYVFIDWTCNGTGCYSGTATSKSVTLNNPINETAVFQSTTTSTSTTSTSTSTTSTSTSTTSTSTSTTSTSTSTTSTSTTIPLCLNYTNPASTTSYCNTGTTPEYNINLNIADTGAARTTVTDTNTSVTLYSSPSPLTSCNQDVGTINPGDNQVLSIYTSDGGSGGSYCGGVVQTQLVATTSTSTSTTTSTTTSTSIPYCSAGYVGQGGYSSSGSGTCATPAYLVCAGTSTQGFASVNWTVQNAAGGTNEGDKPNSAICSQTPNNAHNSNQVLGVASVPNNYPVSILSRINKSVANGGSGDAIDVFSTSKSPDELIMIAYTGSTTETTNNNYLVEGTGCSSNGCITNFTTGVQIQCSSQTQHNASYSSITGVNMADEVAYVICPNVPPGTYSTPGWDYQDGSSYSIIVYGFAPSTSTTTTTTTTTVSGGGDGGSVYGNVNVTLANGTTEPAYKVTPGTVVMSYNKHANKLSPSVISSVFARHTNNKYIFNNRIAVDSGEVMLINGTWTTASSARIGETFFDPLNNSNVRINSINITYYNNTNHTVYDFVGSPFNNYIANGYLIDVISSTTSVSGQDLAVLPNYTTEAIQNLKPGTVVLGYNLQTKQLVPTVLTAIYARTGTNEYIINNGELTIDNQEGLLINNTMGVGADLKVGDYLYDPLTGQKIRVNSLKIINGNFKLYEVLTTPTQNMLANGFVIT